MAAGDARPVPRKNVAYRVTFPILDADGDLVTAAATLDSEVSIDGAAFADATAEATEIATGSGMYFLDLTSAEMNGDTIAVIVKTGTAGAKTAAIVMYPEEIGDYRVNVEQYGGVAGIFAAGRPQVNTSHVGGTLQTAGDIPARLPAALAAGRMDSSVGAMAADVVTAAAVATGAIDADAIALSAADEIIGAVSGTADSGTTTTIVDTERTEADTDYWKGSLVVFTSGTLNGQTRLITAFNAATDTLTFAPATTAAVGTHTYRILPAGRADIHLWLGSLVNALIAGRIDSNAQVVGTGAIVAGSFVAGALDAAAAAADLIDEFWDEAASGHTTAGSFGDRLRAHLAAMLKAVIGVGSTTTAVKLNATTGIEGGAPSAVNDFYKGRIIIFITGALAGQATDITAYTGATTTLTVTALTSAPADTDTAVIV